MHGFYITASKCLINLYAKRRRRSLQTGTRDDLVVALVGNKNDLEHERTISEESGRAFAEVRSSFIYFVTSLLSPLGSSACMTPDQFIVELSVLCLKGQTTLIVIILIPAYVVCI